MVRFANFPVAKNALALIFIKVLKKVLKKLVKRVSLKRNALKVLKRVHKRISLKKSSNKYSKGDQFAFLFKFIPFGKRNLYNRLGKYEIY